MRQSELTEIIDPQLAESSVLRQSSAPDVLEAGPHAEPSASVSKSNIIPCQSLLVLLATDQEAEKFAEVLVLQVLGNGGFKVRRGQSERAARL